MSVKVGTVALFGFGTVGRAVFDILDKMGLANDVKYIVVRNKQKYIDKEGIANTLFEDNMERAKERIQEVDNVIEVMGGTTDAWEVVKMALKMDKKVITANKALVSTYMSELQELLNTDDAGIRSIVWDKFHFEAAVAGGIPIIRSLVRDVQDIYRQNMQGFTTQKLYAILNGTSNFILTKMEQEGMTYGDALRLAQSIGYAEADPSADVKGYDARAKIHILEQILFSTDRKADDIVCEGIENITNVDFEYASLLNSKIKLVATTTKACDNHVSTFVMPTLVPSNKDVAKTDGVRNIVCIEHPFLGTLSYSGPGAGGYATAHSVVSDIFDFSIVYPLGNPEYKSFVQNDFEIPFYLRITVIDCIGIIADIGSLCKDLNISVDAVIQKPLSSSFDFVNDDLTFVVTTNATKYSTIQILKQKIESMEWNKKAVFVMALN